MKFNLFTLVFEYGFLKFENQREGELFFRQLLEINKKYIFKNIKSTSRK